MAIISKNIEFSNEYVGVLFLLIAIILAEKKNSDNDF